MSFGQAFHLVRALKASVLGMPQLWAKAWLSLSLLFALLLVGQSHLIDQLGVWGHRGFIISALLFHIVVIGALYRIALFDRFATVEGLGFGGLQFTKPELRLMGAGILVSLFWFLVFIALCVVLALFLGATDLASVTYETPQALYMALINGPQPQGIIVLCVIGIIMLTLLILWVKLWLHQAATVAEHQMVSLNALSLSSGQTVKLFLGYVYILIPFVIFAEITARQVNVNLAGFDLALALNLCVGVFIFLPLSIGFFANAYRQISELRAKA
jgi:hypothetical protein